MDSLSAAKLLEVWERGAKSVPVGRALLLLGADDAARSEQLAQLSIGQRDARLLELRAQTFGPLLSCLGTCPACRENLEWTLNVTDLLVGERAAGETPASPFRGGSTGDPPVPSGDPPDGTGDGSLSIRARSRSAVASAVPLGESPSGAGGSPALPTLNTYPAASFRLEWNGYQVTFRLPTGRDLAGLSPNVGLPENRQRLLEACVLSARRDGADLATHALPPEVAVAVARRMAELDPQADIRLKLDCPQCGHAWEMAFDILSFFWAEIRAEALRLLGEVHQLASAYSWREAEILAMTPQRRQAYLEMVRA